MCKDLIGQNVKKVWNHDCLKVSPLSSRPEVIMLQYIPAECQGDNLQPRAFETSSLPQSHTFSPIRLRSLFSPTDEGRGSGFPPHIARATHSIFHPCCCGLDSIFSSEMYRQEWAIHCLRLVKTEKLAIPSKICGLDVS